MLDLAPVGSGQSASEALRRTLDLARLAEDLGFARYWFAEHHGLPAVASSSPEVLIAAIAARTQRIRLGSGGIMLPNHAPLRVAESFHSLSALYPGRIDLGIGRAPGSDVSASRALRAAGGEQFSSLMSELLSFFGRLYQPGHPFHHLPVMPSDANAPPIWILGSSGASAQSAGAAGMGYAFATHFSPEPAAPAIQAYRAAFRPSAHFPEPHAIVAVSFVCAQTEDEARYHGASLDLMRLRMLSNEFPPIPSPEEALAYSYTDSDRQAIARHARLNVVGAAEAVAEQLMTICADANADELMLVCNMHSHQHRLKAHELVSSAMSARG